MNVIGLSALKESVFGKESNTGIVRGRVRVIDGDEDQLYKGYFWELSLGSKCALYMAWSVNKKCIQITFGLWRLF